LARKTRCKKREELDLLREQVEHLQSENDKLRVVVKSRQALATPDFGSQLLMKEIPESSLNFDIQLPENVVKMVQMVIARAESIDCTTPGESKYARKAFCITNATAPDNPIVYASPGFMELTGYDMHSILGHNCRFLQGPETDRNEVSLNFNAQFDSLYFS
jgi:PAS domain-containing protein